MLDTRFANNPLVTGAPHIRFYAGAPLVTPEGEVLGTLCVIDRVPRQLSQEQQEALRVLAHQVMAQFELRCRLAELERSAAERVRYEHQLEEYQKKLEKYRAAGSAEHVDELTAGRIATRSSNA